MRLRGYTEAIEAAGLSVEPELVQTAAAYRFRDGAAAMTRLCELPDPPDAVFCFNDPLALGAMRTLHERGLRVPADVAVAGFDDIEASQFSVPSLTTVSPDKAQTAEYAVALLERRRGSGQDSPPVELQARSVGGPGEQRRPRRSTPCMIKVSHRPRGQPAARRPG